VGLAAMTSAKDLPSFFKRAYFFTHGNQHIAEFDQLRLVANGTMSRNDDGLIRNPRDISLRRANHSVNTAAGCAINEREIPIPERIG